jgi:hypothetical protein
VGSSGHQSMLAVHPRMVTSRGPRRRNEPPGRVRAVTKV